MLGVVPADGTTFEFRGEEYRVEVFARVVGSRNAALLQSVDPTLPVAFAEQLENESAGVYFDWGSDSQSYHVHVDVRGESTLNSLRSAVRRERS